MNRSANDFESRSFLATPEVRSLLPAKQGPYGAHVQHPTRTVDDTLENLLHDAAIGEQQIAAVFQLVDRPLVTHVQRPLLGNWQQITQDCRKKPSLADLLQGPFSARRAQGLCHLVQFCELGGRRETVAFLGKGNRLTQGLSGYVLVAVENHLQARGYQIYCGFDADQSGETTSRQMITRHRLIQRLRPPGHDWNDVLTAPSQ